MVPRTLQPTFFQLNHSRQRGKLSLTHRCRLACWPLAATIWHASRIQLKVLVLLKPLEAPKGTF